MTGYIDVFKRTCAKISNITNEEMLDHFVHGLAVPIQREILKQDPPTFSATCQMAERLARLDAVIDARFNTSNNNKNKQIHNTNPYNQGGFLPTDVQMSLLDYLQVPRKCNNV